LLRYDLKINDIYSNIIFREIAQMISLLALQIRDTLERHVKVIMIWTGRVVREAEHLPIPAGETRHSTASTRSIVHLEFPLHTLNSSIDHGSNNRRTKALSIQHEIVDKLACQSSDCLARPGSTHGFRHQPDRLTFVERRLHLVSMIQIQW
jgi:hypothetical protein